MIFVLDTNALWKVRCVGRLSQAVRARGFRLQVPALVHAERVAQLRRQHGDKFDLAVIQSFIDTHSIEVVSFDRVAAEGYAERITSRYPDDDAWHAAKRERCAMRFQVVAEAGKACPATVDWFISRGRPVGGGHERVIVVTDDAGVEYDDAEVLSLDRAIAFAEALPPGDSAGVGGVRAEHGTRVGDASQRERDVHDEAT